MLEELRVCQLGVIEDVTVLLGDGMTALTGETGAGKTLLVDAIELLLGGPADPSRVRPGASEAVVEARFSMDGAADVVVCRVLPAKGRTRAYIDGRMVSAGQLAELGARLVDLHGQHAHQSLLAPAPQRAALDRSARISTDPVQEARRRLRAIRDAQEKLGGDARTRARELDLAKYQLAEITSAGITGPEEDQELQEEEERLADASGLRDAATSAWQGLDGEDGVSDRLGQAAAAVAGRKSLDAVRQQVIAIQQEVADAASEARRIGEAAEDDPERLAAVGARRQVLADLRRKYGATLTEVIAFGHEVRDRVVELEAHDQRAAALDVERAEAEEVLAEAERALSAARTEAAPALAAAIEARLSELAMPKARFEIEVDGDAVTWLLGANPGEPVLPLAKVASGGELARTMLAARLALGGSTEPVGDEGPLTLVFDEVDAGVGGEAALAVGRALAMLTPPHQVLVVTHLPQVAAFADHHLAVLKSTQGGRTVAAVEPVEGGERVVELARMLSGSPRSETARRHAEELLDRARSGR